MSAEAAAPESRTIAGTPFFANARPGDGPRCALPTLRPCAHYFLLRKPWSLRSRPTTHHHHATDFRGRPAAIVFAAGEADVVAAVRFCAERGLPLVGRGAGTGLSGGCVPANGELVVSTERLTELSIDPARRIAFCGPGVITKHLQDQALVHGLAYPPDPASFDQSTLGGNVAENAGGLRCKRFGVTRDYVLGVRGVTGEGRLLETGIFNQNRGFDLMDILIGSEGTLAIITRIALRLILAGATGITILVAFRQPEDAARAVAEITGSGLIPTVLEYVDGDAAAAANAYRRTEGIDRAAAVLLIETTERDPEEETAHIRAVCERHRASYLRVEPDAQAAETLWDVRRNISTALKA
ncbi:MAG TPA: FAD-binding oxidoreductase, partial [candidate division Zixibacteria bacterium]|nr:FAD-binding oxidoreductase [candidate division Zixibacteria bacterium]